MIFNSHFKKINYNPILLYENYISSEKLLIAVSVWCLSVKCHFVNVLYI